VLQIYVDADGCPVKDEVYRVARRHGLGATVVANARMRIPRKIDSRWSWWGPVRRRRRLDRRARGARRHRGVGGYSARLALLQKGAVVLDQRGGLFTVDNIGSALASREISSHLRDLGNLTGGPRPFSDRDRSRFLHRLDEAIRGFGAEPGVTC